MALAANNSDWGYDNTHKSEPQEQQQTPPPPPEQQPAMRARAGSLEDSSTPPLKALPTAPVKKGTTPVKQPVHAQAKPKPAAPAQPSYFSHKGHPGGSSSPSGSGSSSSDAIADWLQLYGAVSPQPLTDEQKGRLEQSLKSKLSAGQKQQVLGILSFWDQVDERLKASVDDKEAVSMFFKALMRFAEHNPNTSKDDQELLGEVLGPERIAVPAENQDPALTEDAIDAYSDMVCFMYEQSHPGKTIDASDNRTLMAAVISDKFHNAPNTAARKAMANFAFSWGKFKLQWLQADETERKRLAEGLKGSGPNVMAGKSPFVDKVLSTGPWSTTSSSTH